MASWWMVQDPEDVAVVRYSLGGQGQHGPVRGGATQSLHDGDDASPQEQGQGASDDPESMRSTVIKRPTTSPGGAVKSHLGFLSGAKGKKATAEDSLRVVEALRSPCVVRGWLDKLSNRYTWQVRGCVDARVRGYVGAWVRDEHVCVTVMLPLSLPLPSTAAVLGGAGPVPHVLAHGAQGHAAR